MQAGPNWDVSSSGLLMAVVWTRVRTKKRLVKVFLTELLLFSVRVAKKCVFHEWELSCCLCTQYRVSLPLQCGNTEQTIMDKQSVAQVT